MSPDRFGAAWCTLAQIPHMRTVAQTRDDNDDDGDDSWGNSFVTYTGCRIRLVVFHKFLE